MYRILILP